MGKHSTDMDWIQTLQNQVKEHPVLQAPWLLERSKQISLDDVLLWLSQEYFVSIGFVDWFLEVARQTDDQLAKIVLVENIWEELGEGKISDTHVSILKDFLTELQFDFTHHIKFESTLMYLEQMESIIKMGFYYGLGALGPANEYLLKLEYSKMNAAYQSLKERIQLPEGKFFQVNLNADEGHAARMFDLIRILADNDEKKKMVEEGNRRALDARLLFYEGLSRMDK